ncbi:MAG: SurA N-terminal domain-containing protein [Nitrospirae bacterium]|nr:SurA N-terminal domain-containing protein [Nitrospirota bacterium]
MLQFMRKHAKFFYVFFFIIIISFIFFYVGPVDKSSMVPVAEVGKEQITLEEYWRTYDRTRDFYRDIYKEKFDEDMEKKLRLKEKVLDSLIEEKVLLLTAVDIGIKVKDEEVEEAIMHEPAFTRNGVFDREVYLRTLQLSRVTPEFFENAKRQELTLKKIRRLIGESVDITDIELKMIQGNEQTVNALRQAVLVDKREKAIKSYVEALKKQIKVKINSQLIS